MRDDHDILIELRQDVRTLTATLNEFRSEVVTKVERNEERIGHIHERLAYAGINGKPRSTIPSNGRGWYVPRWTVLVAIGLLVLVAAGAVSLDLAKTREVVEVVRDIKSTNPLE